MFSYYLRLAIASFRRNPGLTALMVMAIGLGIAVCMITLTSYRAAANNPAGKHGEILFSPSLDSWDPEDAYDKDDSRWRRACSRTATPGPCTRRKSRIAS